MNGEHQAEIDRRVKELSDGVSSDHDTLLRIQATQEFMVDNWDNLPCRSNDPAVNPQQRLATVEAEVKGVRRQATKNSATIGTIVAFVVNGLFVLGRVFWSK